MIYDSNVIFAIVTLLLGIPLIVVGSYVFVQYFYPEKFIGYCQPAGYDQCTMDIEKAGAAANFYEVVPVAPAHPERCKERLYCWNETIRWK